MRDLARYLVAALLAAVTLWAMLFGLAKVSGPGEVMIIRQLDLLTSSETKEALGGERAQPEPPEEDERPGPPPRPSVDPDAR